MRGARRQARGWRRRPLVIAAALPLVASLAVACGSGGPGGGDQIDVWVYQDASTAIQERFAEEFNEESGIDVNLVQIPGENYQDRMRTAMGGSNAPDVFFHWGGGSIVDFVEEDALVDLTPYFTEDPEFQEAFLPTLLDGSAIDGRYYGVPMRGVQPVILFYNQTLFDEAGVEPPETYDDLLTLVDVFQQRDVTPIALGGGDAWTELMWLEYLLDRQGGAGVFERIQAGDMSAWGDPAVLEAARMATDLVERGAFGDNFRSATYTNDNISTFFAQGDAAMHLMGSWEYANQLANQPDFAENDLAYTTFPVIEGGAGDPAAVVGNTTNYWSVHSDLEGERLQAAVDFVRLAATPEYAQALVENGDVPPTSDAAELLDAHADPGFARFTYDLVTQAPTFQLSWNQALPVRQAAPMDAAIQEMFSGQLSPEDFVEEMRAL